MTTPRKAEANRRNARRSTGPRTTTGKALSSKNAMKHGLLSQHIVIPGEDPKDFERLRNAVIEELQPETALEALCTEQIAAYFWRLRRIHVLEAGVFTHEHDDIKTVSWDLNLTDLEPDYPGEGDKEGAAAAEEAQRKYLSTLGLVYWRAERALSSLSRYEATLARQLQRLLREYERLREARQDGPVIDGTAEAS